MEQDMIVAKLLDELRMGSYEITKKPGETEHTFESPKGRQPDREAE